MIDKILTQLMYNPREPMIFSSGLFLVLFLGFTFVYMLLQRKLTARCKPRESNAQSAPCLPESAY